MSLDDPADVGKMAGARVVHPNPEDHTIIALVCRRCGQVRDPRQYLPASNAEGVAWGGVYLSNGR